MGPSSRFFLRASGIRFIPPASNFDQHPNELKCYIRAFSAPPPQDNLDYFEFGEKYKFYDAPHSSDQICEKNKM